MKRQDFQFDLPQELIAQRPLAERTASRLLVVNKRDAHLSDQRFEQLGNWVRPGDLLVFNNTKVLKARLHGRKSTGGAVEILVERLLDPLTALVQLRASKSPKAGATLHIADLTVVVRGRQEEFFELTASLPWSDLLERHGHLPLPPYIARADDEYDERRYQTVYAQHPGAVAAPTAGLHFSDPLLAQLRQHDVQFGYLTLHVGAGTFQPVRTSDIRQHKMHSEWVEVGAALAEQVTATRAAGGRVVAVGTTSLRSLESAWRDGQVHPFRGDTDIFIYPGVSIRSVDALITNFHLPESTLMMLVSAMAGTETIRRAYQHAIEQRYRFFSYGDAMLIL